MQSRHGKEVQMHSYLPPTAVTGRGIEGRLPDSRYDCKHHRTKKTHFTSGKEDTNPRRKGGGEGRKWLGIPVRRREANGGGTKKKKVIKRLHESQAGLLGSSFIHSKKRKRTPHQWGGERGEGGEFK